MRQPKYTALFFIDIDGTLFDFEESEKLEGPIYIGLEQQRERFTKLHEAGCKLIPCTSRGYGKEPKQEFLSMLSILDEVTDFTKSIALKLLP